MAQEIERKKNKYSIIIFKGIPIHFSDSELLMYLEKSKCVKKYEFIAKCGYIFCVKIVFEQITPPNQQDLLFKIIIKLRYLRSLAIKGLNTPDSIGTLKHVGEGVYLIDSILKDKKTLIKLLSFSLKAQLHAAKQITGRSILFPEGAFLFISEYKEVLRTIALNPYAILHNNYRQFFFTADAELRVAAASNPNAPLLKHYVLLFEDRILNVREAVARNPNAPVSNAFKKLLKDSSTIVQSLALANLQEHQIK